VYNSVRTIETNNLAQRIQEDTSISSQQTQNTLAFIIRRLEAIEAQRPYRRLADREENIVHMGDEESEYNFRMRRFMVETASVLSSSPRGSVVVAESLGRPVSPSLAISLDDSRDDNDSGGDGDDDDDIETVVVDVGRQLPKERTVSIPNSTAPPQTKDGDGALSKAAAASKLGRAKREGRLTSDTDFEALISQGRQRFVGSDITTSNPRRAERSLIRSLPNAPHGISHELPTPAASSTLGSNNISIFSNQSSRIANSPEPIGTDLGDSAQARTVREHEQVDRVPPRPTSMAQTYQPPLMELTQDTSPELQAIFTYLNSHGNKLYKEGYFLKLDYLDLGVQIFSSVSFYVIELTWPRWQANCEESVDRMLCAALWDHPFVVGRNGA
jgi:hypothetical protein